MAKKRSVRILYAEDDKEDQMLMEKAREESRLANNIDYVDDGIEMMDYLSRQGKYAHLQGTPLPGLILLDLNMPKKDGREVLREIKSDPSLKKIPVVVLTTSKAEEDILESYNLGVNSYIRKPVTFDALVQIIQKVSEYWFEIVELPMRP